MKKLAIMTVAAVLAGASSLAGQVDLGISVSDGKLRAFYLSVGDFYGVPGPQVVAVRDRYRLPDEELPVVFFLAAQAHVAPSVIMDLRLGGKSWLDITFHYGLDPNAFFIPVGAVRMGPPYGHAYGYYGKFQARRDWRKIALTDADVIGLVNLKFMTQYHRVPPESIMERRGRGEGLVSINDSLGRAKAKKGGPWDPANAKKPKGKGKGKRK